MSRTIELGRRTIEISHPDKVWFPGDGLTKAEIVDYYRRVADHMLPHLESRPVTLHRWPDGIEGNDFFQQARPDHLPDWVDGATLERKGGGEVTHPVADDVASLLVLVNTGCITPHMWLSRRDRPDHPDRMVFDLDPPESDGIELVRSAATALRRVLDELELAPLVNSTGSRGLHVVVPLAAEDDYDSVREFARDVARVVADRQPDRFTLEQRRAQRKGRLYLDIMRNAYGQHVVAPYAVRALPHAPVAAPLDWSEIGRSSFSVRRWRVDNLFRRLGQRDDPWKGAWRHARRLGTVRDRLDDLLNRESSGGS
jgi:bifunctional non-homologous end joining protein LigD